MTVVLDARRTKCPTCGAKVGFDCIEIGGAIKLYEGHAARQIAVQRLDDDREPAG